MSVEHVERNVIAERADKLTVRLDRSARRNDQRIEISVDIGIGEAQRARRLRLLIPRTALGVARAGAVARLVACEVAVLEPHRHLGDVLIGFGKAKVLAILQARHITVELRHEISFVLDGGAFFVKPALELVFVRLDHRQQLIVDGGAQAAFGIEIADHRHDCQQQADQSRQDQKLLPQCKIHQSPLPILSCKPRTK